MPMPIVCLESRPSTKARSESTSPEFTRTPSRKPARSPPRLPGLDRKCFGTDLGEKLRQEFPEEIGTTIQGSPDKKTSIANRSPHSAQASNAAREHSRGRAADGIRQAQGRGREAAAAIDAGAVRCHLLPRKQHVFDRRDFPAESQTHIGPNSP